MKQYELHGHTKGRKRTATWQAWMNMIMRCTNPNRPDYKDYGGRGIAVCKEWRSFFTFLADMGECPKGKSLDRYPDNSGGYGPGNCRWATKDEQMQNTRATRLLTCNGQTMGLTAWARSLGITHSSIQGRIKRGWTIEKALSTGRMK